MGRGRTLEAIVVADDFPAELAERYGYINRSVPDPELDAFVDRIARRLANLDKEALADAKRLVDRVTLPDDALFPRALASFFLSVARPETRARTAKLIEAGLQQRSDVEMRLGHHVAP